MARIDYRNHPAIAADRVLGYNDIKNYGRFPITGAGVRVTMPDAIDTLCRDNWDFIVDNEASAPALVKGDFAGGVTGIVLQPGTRLYGMYVNKMGEAANEIRYLAHGGVLGEKGTYQQTVVTDGDGFNDVTKAGYWTITPDGGAAFLYGYVTTADGDGETLVSISLPPNMIPPNCGIEIPVATEQVIDGVVTEALGYIDLSSATAAERQVINFRGASAFTNAKTSTMRYCAFIPLDLTKWVSISKTETWATGTPASITESCYAKIVGDFCVEIGQFASADSNGATGLSIPFYYPSQDLDSYMPGLALQTQVDGADATTYLNPLLLLDLANNTEASRLAACQNFMTAIDAKAVQVSYIMAYPVAKTNSQWASFDADPVYTQGVAALDPATNVVEKGYWGAADGVLGMLIYQSADDGNGCTAVVNELPMKPAGLEIDIPLWGYQYQHSDTMRNPIPRLDVADENIQCDLLHALDDTEATKLYIGGIIPIC